MNEPTTVLCRAGKHTMGFNPGQFGLPEKCIVLREDELVHESCTWEKTAAHLALALHDLDIAAERISTLEAENKRLRAEWPRVYFNSQHPTSATVGFEVVSVGVIIKGRCNWGCWSDVLVRDSDGEEFLAPTDFGLYSTPEAAANAAQADKGKP